MDNMKTLFETGSGGYQAGVALSANMKKYIDQGGRDALILFNRYGCDSDVTHAVISNINAYFDKNIRPIIPGHLSSVHTSQSTAAMQFDRWIGSPIVPRDSKTSEQGATPQPNGTLRTPGWFNCSKASRGADYVICASPVLLDAVARLEDAFIEAKAARGNDVLAEHKAWLESYSENCGLPARGNPDDSQITGARHCVLSSINKRIAELNAEH
jgi:uncharacterized protein YecT (DUF1311 family)